jgi:hypothetical protein
MYIEAFGKKFELLNDDKFDRAVHGTVGRMGAMQGGVGDNASDEAKLTEYDRLGGAIRFNGSRVKRGCFYDFASRKPFHEDEVEVTIVLSINGQNLEFSADEPITPEKLVAAGFGKELLPPETDVKEGESLETIAAGRKRRVRKPLAN